LIKKIHLLVFDVDGTLSIDGEPIENSVAQQLVELEKKGFQICLASGKDYYYLKALARGMGLSKVWFIAENGAVYFTDKMYYTIPIMNTINFTRTIIEKIKKDYPQVILQPNDVMITAFINDYEIKNEICKSIKKLGIIEGITANIYIHPSSLDVIPEDIDKAAALVKIKNEYGLTSSQIIAVGDYSNDICLAKEVSMLIIVGSKLPDTIDYLKVDCIMDAFDYLNKNLVF